MGHHKDGYCGKSILPTVDTCCTIVAIADEILPPSKAQLKLWRDMSMITVKHIAVPKLVLGCFWVQKLSSS